MSRSKSFWIVISIAFILGGLACFTLKNRYENYSTQLSMFGTFASLLGIIVAIVQAWEVRNISSETKEKIGAVLSISNLSQILLLPAEIQDLVMTDDYQRAYDKM